MELIQWFLIGVLFTLSVLGISWLSLVIEAPWYAWAGISLGAIMILFSLGWAGASFLEGYPQSGALGLVMFGGSGIMVITGVWRLIIQPLQNNKSN